MNKPPIFAFRRFLHPDLLRGLVKRSATLPQYLAETLLAARCHLCCDATTTLLCPACSESLPSNNGARCRYCDLPMPEAAPCCADCLLRPPSFACALSAYRYEFPIDKLLNDLKQRQGHMWARYLTEALAHRVQCEYAQLPDYLLATPLHWRRRLIRGFNQSALITRELSQRLNIPIFTGLHKAHLTPPQQGLNRQQRLRNLRHSFLIDGSLTDCHVAIVDDVLTTGATAHSITDLLTRAGARRVDVWTLARTPKPHQDFA